MSVVEASHSVQQAAQDLAQRLSPATRVVENEPMSKHTTLRVGGPADIYIEPANEADLAVVLATCTRQRIPWMMVGRGSNLLVRDGGIRGVVICLSAPGFSEIRINGDRVHCGAGA